MNLPILPNGGRVAVFVDCDNAQPAMLEHALQAVERFGRAVLRRGYGNQGSLQATWQEALLRRAFTPCLQYRYATGKNTADIALALDALEALCDHRADTFCVVTSDSDFTYLCGRLRERGATVLIVGEAKTPEALRNASDQFFEWRPKPAPIAAGAKVVNAVAAVGKTDVQGQASAVVERQPTFVIDAVMTLATKDPEGKVGLPTLGHYLKETYPCFSPRKHGHAGLLKMLKTYKPLVVETTESGHCTVRPRAAAPPAAAA